MVADKPMNKTKNFFFYLFHFIFCFWCSFF